MIKTTATIALLANVLLALSGCAEEAAEGNSVDSAKADVGQDMSTAEQALTDFKACRGDGHWVCDEHVDPIYFSRHPACMANPNCGGVYYACAVNDCPAPAADEIPNARVVGGGAVTTSLQTKIYYLWASQGTGGNHAAWQNSGLPWLEYRLGVGVYVPSERNVTVICNESQSNRKFSNITVVWANGQRQVLPCDAADWGVCEANVPLNGGLVATCNVMAI
jgi:hypothetical protein